MIAPSLTYCPHCERMNIPDAVRCRFCQRRLDPPTAPSTVPLADPPAASASGPRLVEQEEQPSAAAPPSIEATDTATPPTSKPTRPATARSLKAQELQAALDEIRDGDRRLITLFGPSRAGKTEYMRALFRRIRAQGATPGDLEGLLNPNILGTTRGSNPGRYKFNFNRQAWCLVDIGGEFFDDLLATRRDDAYLETQYAFLSTIARSRGFMFFVHLSDLHFETPGRHQDDVARGDAILAAQRSFGLLRHLLLFARAQRLGFDWKTSDDEAETHLHAALERKRFEAGLEQFIDDHDRRDSSLDAALAVVLTKADLYAEPDRDILLRPGRTLSPRSNPIGASWILRDHLPDVFTLLNRSVRYWKADYCRAAIGTTEPDEDGFLTRERLIPDDPATREDLSVGVVSLFDFVLEFARPSGRIPRLRTARALRLVEWLEQLRGRG